MNRPGCPGVLALLLALLAVTTTAADRVSGPVAAEVVRVIDGDTIAVRAHVWPGQVVEMPVRLAGVDAPERNGACADERARAAEATVLLERLLASGHATLTDIAFDKYGGRAVARVATDLGDVGQALMRAGLARRYSGGRREGWCGVEVGR